MILEKVNNGNFQEKITNSAGKRLLIVGLKNCPDTEYLLKCVLPDIVESYTSTQFLYAEIALDSGKIIANKIIHDALEIERYPTIVSYLGGKILEKMIAENQQQQRLLLRLMLKNLSLV